MTFTEVSFSQHQSMGLPASIHKSSTAAQSWVHRDSQREMTPANSLLKVSALRGCTQHTWYQRLPFTQPLWGQADAGRFTVIPFTPRSSSVRTYHYLHLTDEQAKAQGGPEAAKRPSRQAGPAPPDFQAHVHDLKRHCSESSERY